MLLLGAPVRDLFLGPPWPSRKGSRIEAVESTDRSPSPDPNPAVPQDCLPGPPQIEPASPLTGSSPWLCGSARVMSSGVRYDVSNLGCALLFVPFSWNSAVGVVGVALDVTLDAPRLSRI